MENATVVSHHSLIARENIIMLVQETNLNGVKVRVTRNNVNHMYEVSSYIGGVEQNDLWCDFRSLNNALSYSEQMMHVCHIELELAY